MKRIDQCLSELLTELDIWGDLSRFNEGVCNDTNLTPETLRSETGASE